MAPLAVVGATAAAVAAAVIVVFGLWGAPQQLPCKSDCDCKPLDAGWTWWEWREKGWCVWLPALLPGVLWAVCVLLLPATERPAEDAGRTGAWEEVAEVEGLLLLEPDRN